MEEIETGGVGGQLASVVPWMVGCGLTCLYDNCTSRAPAHDPLPPARTAPVSCPTMRGSRCPATRRRSTAGTSRATARAWTSPSTSGPSTVMPPRRPRQTCSANSRPRGTSRPSTAPPDAPRGVGLHRRRLHVDRIGIELPETQAAGGASSRCSLHEHRVQRLRTPSIAVAKGVVLRHRRATRFAPRRRHRARHRRARRASSTTTTRRPAPSGPVQVVDTAAATTRVHRRQRHAHEGAGDRTTNDSAFDEFCAGGAVSSGGHA